MIILEFNDIIFLMISDTSSDIRDTCDDLLISKFRFCRLESTSSGRLKQNSLKASFLFTSNLKVQIFRVSHRDVICPDLVPLWQVMTKMWAVKVKRLSRESESQQSILFYFYSFIGNIISSICPKSNLSNY